MDYNTYLQGYLHKESRTSTPTRIADMLGRGIPPGVYEELKNTSRDYEKRTGKTSSLLAELGGTLAPALLGAGLATGTAYMNARDTSLWGRPLPAWRNPALIGLTGTGLFMGINVLSSLAALIKKTRTEKEQDEAEERKWSNAIPGVAPYNLWKRLGYSYEHRK